MARSGSHCLVLLAGKPPPTFKPPITTWIEAEMEFVQALPARIQHRAGLALASVSAGGVHKPIGGARDAGSSRAESAGAAGGGEGAPQGDGRTEGGNSFLDCDWVGSSRGFPLSPPKVKLFAGGSTATQFFAGIYVQPKNIDWSNDPLIFPFSPCLVIAPRGLSLFFSLGPARATEERFLRLKVLEACERS